jgi:hypothetical protein
MKQLSILLSICFLFVFIQLYGTKKRKYVSPENNVNKLYKKNNNYGNSNFLVNLNILPKELWSVIAQYLKIQEKSNCFYAFSLISKYAFSLRDYFIKDSSLLVQAIFYHQELDLIQKVKIYQCLNTTEDGYFEERHCSTNFNNKAFGRKVWFPTTAYLLYLIEQEAVVNCVLFDRIKTTPLQYAINCEHSLIKPLYERGALLDVNHHTKVDRIPFWEYFESCRGMYGGKVQPMNCEILQLLFDPSVVDLYEEVNFTDHQTYWHYLCEFSDKETVCFFLNQLNNLEKDPFVFARSLFNRGYTALHFACRRGDIEVVQFLLNNGFNKYLNRQDKPNHITTLFVACRHLRVDLVPLLLQAGADITQFDINGRTPLMLMQEWLEDISIYESKFLADNSGSLSGYSFFDDTGKERKKNSHLSINYFEDHDYLDNLRRKQKIELIITFLLA